MMKQARLFGLLGALYFAQGLPFGFFTQALPVMLRQLGVSLEGIGLTSLLALPWALKFLVAPALDRSPSRRRWLLALQLATAGLLVLASRLDPTALVPILVVVFLVNTLAATQDIATDAIAVDEVPRAHRGLANGLQVGAYRVGMILGGGALLLTFDLLQWSGVFLVMAAATLLTTLPVARWKEPARQPVEGVASLKDFFTRADAAPLLLLLFVFKFGEAFGVTMLKPRLVDLGLSLADVGLLVGTVGFLAGLVGAVTGGLLVNVVGRQRALVGFGFTQAVAVLAYVAVDRETSFSGLAVLVGFEHFAGGLATAALFTCIMDWSRAGHAATDSTVQASTVVIATGIASASSGVSAAVLGYRTHFELAAALAMLAAVSAGALFRRITQKERPCSPAALPSTPEPSTP
jgi:MFS transporter, PAT family, beta-lactamase induction signal transducer AmpG